MCLLRVEELFKKKNIFKVFNFATCKSVYTVLSKGSITSKTKHGGFIYIPIKNKQKYMGDSSTFSPCYAQCQEKDEISFPSERVTTVF